MKTVFLFIAILSMSFSHGQNKQVSASQKAINTVLEDWHKAAADADFDAYFNKMTADSHFIGTDATENWQFEEFKAFSKPYFDKGKAWSFTTIERNIFIEKNAKIAWFDEHLKTQMGICRGSGVLRNVDGQWKIAHYVLSIAVPNENVTALTSMKKDWDSNHLKKRSKQ